MRYLAFAALVASIAISGCKSDANELTDEQLITIFGGQDSFTFGNKESEGPILISRSITECMHFLAQTGSSDQGNGDAAFMRATCAEDIGRILSRQDVAPDLSLDDISDSDFANRLTQLSEAQLAARDAWKKEKRVAEQQERRAALEPELAALKERVASMRDQFDEMTQPIRAGCISYVEGYKQMRELDRFHPIMSKGRPTGCGLYDVPLKIATERFEQDYETVMAYELPEELGRSTRLPRAPDFDPEDYSEMQEVVAERVAAMDAALAETKAKAAE